MKTRHTMARVRKGLYNYRGYCIYKCKAGWVIRDEDNKPMALHRRLSDLRKTLDKCERP